MTTTNAISTSPHVNIHATGAKAELRRPILKFFAYAMLIFITLLILTAIAIPNLLRSRVAANEASAVGSLRVLNVAKTTAESEQGSNDKSDNERKVKRVGTLNILVKDPSAAVSKIQGIVAEYHGVLLNQEMRTFEGSARSGTVTIKVPEGRFFQAWSSLHEVADRVEDEKIEATDVTSEMVDIESRIRNDQAEEQQYHEIMKRAGSIKDILAVSEKMGEVRGKIEEAQGQLKLMKSDTEMSSIVIGFRMPSVVVARGVNWTPQQHFQEIWVGLEQSLADYADFIVAALFFLPMFVLWTATILVPLYGLIRLFQWAKPRLANALSIERGAPTT